MQGRVLFCNTEDFAGILLVCICMSILHIIIAKHLAL